MKYIERVGVGAVVTFCDDIRQEIHNKHVLVGVYPGYELILATSKFPTVIPKMGMYIKYYEEKETFPTYTTVESFMPGEEHAFFSAELDQEEIDRSIFSATTDLPLCGFALVSLMSPVIIPREGNLNVYARNNDRRLRLGTLKIKSDPQAKSLPFE